MMMPLKHPPRRLTPRSYTDGTRTWLGSSLRRAWPWGKPHIYLSKDGWKVRYMSYRRPVAGGPYIFLRTAMLAAFNVWHTEYKEGKRKP